MVDKRKVTNGNLATREAWLNKAMNLFKPWFVEVGAPLPKKIRTSCGFPRARRKAIGQCFSTSASSAGFAEIFVSPVLDDTARVLDVLLHELIHAADDCKSGHKGEFRRVALALGLTGSMKATVASPELRERLEREIIAKLGEYPHAALADGATSGPKKQGTRLLKAACGECGYTVRVTAKWLEVGAPICPTCEEPMNADA